MLESGPGSKRCSEPHLLAALAGSPPLDRPMSAVKTLLDILDLEQLEVNLFRGRSPQVTWQRVFGGQVIGQALVAACRTVDVKERPPHSMHAYFLLAGDPKIPILYDVDPVGDAKSLTQPH